MIGGIHTSMFLMTRLVGLCICMDVYLRELIYRGSCVNIWDISCIKRTFVNVIRSFILSFCKPRGGSLCESFYNSFLKSK